MFSRLVQPEKKWSLLETLSEIEQLNLILGRGCVFECHYR